MLPGWVDNHTHTKKKPLNFDPCKFSYTQIHISPQPCFLERILHLKFLTKSFPDSSLNDPNGDSTDVCLMKKELCFAFTAPSNQQLEQDGFVA